MIDNIMIRRESERASNRKTEEKQYEKTKVYRPEMMVIFFFALFVQRFSVRFGRWQVFFSFFRSRTLKHNHFGSFQSTNHCSVRIIFLFIHLDFKVNIVRIAHHLSPK